MERRMPVGEMIDQETQKLLGAEGFEFYCVLIRQYEEAQQTIEQDFIQEGQDVYHKAIQQALAEGLPGGEAVVRGAKAQSEAWKGIKDRRDKRLSDAYADFTAKTENLFAWSQNQKRADCPECG